MRWLLDVERCSTDPFRQAELARVSDDAGTLTVSVISYVVKLDTASPSGRVDPASSESTGDLHGRPVRGEDHASYRACKAGLCVRARQRPSHHSGSFAARLECSTRCGGV